MNRIELIAICICTRQRPQMLASCLASVLKQKTPAWARLEVIVIDNNSGEDNATPAIVSGIRLGSPIPVHYAHEARPGLSTARNAALDHARFIRADWIAFIDDDEVAAPDWVSELYECVKRCDEDEPTHAAQGLVRYSFPINAAMWRCERPWADWGSMDGQELPSAGTGNVIFNLRMAAGLRFKETLSFRGGEDTAFFRTFREGGGRIVLSTSAIVTETVPWERITVHGHARKSFRAGVAKVSVARELGTFRAHDWATRALRYTIKGVAKVAVGAPAAMASDRAGRLMLNGIRNLCESAGVFWALTGGDFQYYRNPTGN